MDGLYASLHVALARDFKKPAQYKFAGMVDWIKDAGAGEYWEGFGDGLMPQTDAFLPVTKDEGGATTIDLPP